MMVLYVIIGIIALILLIAAVVGTAWSYEKSILINAPASKVWSHTSTLKGLNSWNPWVEKDPSVKMEFGPTDGVPGASYSWDSDVKQVGAGKQTILSITNKKEMATQVDFLRPFKGTGSAYVRLADENTQTKVTWSMFSSTPYPMNIIKLFGVIEKNMDADFTRGLNKLKGICEH